jgi:hypothetical protein
MRLHPSFIFIVLVVLTGCASHRDVDLLSLQGNLEQAVKANHLERFHSWPSVNDPPDADRSVHYFLDTGDLYIYYSGSPEVIRNIEFWPRETSADERYQAANREWEKYVEAHGGGTTRPK